MTRKFTLFLFTLLFTLKGFSQPFCGTDVKHQQLLASDPAYAAAIQASNTQWAQISQVLNHAFVVNTAKGPVYQIPLVVHIMHTGGAVGTTYNPTDAQINSMVDYLNKTYFATYTSYPDTNNGGVRIPIQFKLAMRDPNCNSTTGITRVNVSTNATIGTTYVANGVNASNSTGVADNLLKDLERWPPYDYYNIWVVNKIDGADGTSGTFTAGFAYIPPASYSLDGCIMLATQAVAGQITLPHEVGHSLGLYHVFQGGSTTVCPTNTNCSTQGDLVCDTEPQRQSVFNCPTGTNPCTGVAYTNGPNNFMDYSSCQNRFTAGQRTRIMTLLPQYRAGLMSSLGATAPVATTMASATCTPTIVNASNAINIGPANVILNDMTAGSMGGYSSDNNQVYLDRTCTQTANIVMGQTYPISVLTQTNAQNVRVYIDYDNNGVFGNNANEIVFSHNASVSSGAETHTGSITIPTLTTGCVYRRMRVVSDISSNTTLGPCTALQYGQAEDYSVYIKPAGATATVSIAITSGTNPTCTGSSITFTGTPSASSFAATPTYQWYVNGVAQAGATSTTFTSSSLTNNSNVTLRMLYTTTTGCSSDSAFSNSIIITTATTAAASVSIALTAGTNPTCAGQSLTFTATPTNGGTTPTYQWRVNGVAQTGATNATYTTSTYANGNIITVTMVSSSSCASPATATSSGITITIGTVTLTPSVSIALTSGANPSCPGTALTFTATPVNGGTAPTYQWKIGGVAVTGATNATFPTTLANGNVITVTMVSNNPCANTTPVTSAGITETATYITPSVTMALTTGTNPSCPGDALTFTATPTNGGTTPTYQWKVNGTAVTGATNATFTSTTLAAGDIVTVTMTSSDVCADPAANSPTSAGITISHATITPSVTLALSGGSTNPDCAGKIINFLATPTNAGTTPTYTWKVNGITVTGVTTNVFSTATLINGDVVTVTVNSSNPCSVPTTATSTGITMTITPLDTPGIELNYVAGSNPGCADSLLSITATATTPGGTVSGYAWYVNNVLVSTTATFSSNALLDGDILTVKAFVSGTGCRTSDTATKTINVVRYAAPAAPVISFINSWLIANSTAKVQWYGPNGLIPGADSIGYHPTEPGYYYCYALNNSCPSLKSNVLKVSLLDIASVSNGSASVYPNPTTGELVIDWGRNVRNVTIEVYSTTGQKLLHDTADNTTHKSINLGALANGNYFIITHDTEGHTTTSGITLSK